MRLLETVYLHEQRLNTGHAAAGDLDQQVYVGSISGRFVDVTRDRRAAAPLLYPTDYQASQRFGIEAGRSTARSYNAGGRKVSSNARVPRLNGWVADGGGQRPIAGWRAEMTKRAVSAHGDTSQRGRKPGLFGHLTKGACPCRHELVEPVGLELATRPCF